MISQYLNKIIQGSALEVLKTFPDESIDCCITSPPYYGLRSYATDPQIWDGKDNCKHEWIENKAELLRDNRNFQTGTQEEVLSNAKGTTHIKSKSELTQGFCIHCNAWKGELGLEPTFQLYLNHLWQIFDEVKRVLKKSGTCWVVIGDSYYGAKGQSGSRDADYQAERYENGETLNKRHQQLGGQKQTRPTDGKQENIPAKSLMNIPSRFAIGMTDRGWIERNEIIWFKRSCMPASVKDRFTVDFEKVYFFVKNKKYYFEQQFDPANYDGRKDTMFKGADKYKGKKGFEIHGNPMERWTKRKLDNTNYAGNGTGLQGHSGYDVLENPYIRNKRAVWEVNPKPFAEAHFAVFPPKLIETPIKAGCPEGEIVLDPFFGSGTTGEVALQLGRNFIGIEINPAYIEIAERRLNKLGLLRNVI